MQELFSELARNLAAGETVAVTTIIRRKGSVPREVGAKMLVHRNGQLRGTVGGGCGEAEVWRNALTAIDTRLPTIVQVDLTEEIALNSQGVCGGIFDVFVQPWYDSPAPGQAAWSTIASAISQALAGEQAVALATIVEAKGSWRETLGQTQLFHENGETLGSLTLSDAPPDLCDRLHQAARDAIIDNLPHTEVLTGPADARVEIFIEPFVPPPVLLIAGAGHIAAPLAELAHTLKFSVSVTDDRPSFANHDRFPHAKQVLVGNIETILRDYPITPRTHIVLVTRAHAHDVQGLRAILASRAAYIGMIGSQRRVWAVFKLLHAEGVSAEQLARVRAPIGLDFGGSTPEEIALCILSEIVLLRRGGTGKPLSDSLRDRYMQRLKHLDEGESHDEVSLEF